MEHRSFGRSVPSTPGRRVAIDLLPVDAVARSLARFGMRYTHRVYAPEELAASVDALGRPDPRRLAGRFAMKEAVLKALDVPDGVALTDIVTVNGPSGAPELFVHGAAAARVAELGVTSASLSISHEAAYAVAMVVLEYDGRAPDRSTR